MNLNFSTVHLPKVMSDICSLTIKNNRATVSEILQIVEKDKFIDLFLYDYLKVDTRSSRFGKLMGVGWDGIRNRIAEAYLFRATNQVYPRSYEEDEIADLLVLEKRYSFMSPERNSRVFMLGMYLKLCDIYVHNNVPDNAANEVHMAIPHEVDEILVSFSSKTHHPDWVILTCWSLFSSLGKEDALTLLKKAKGNMNVIKQEIEGAKFDLLIKNLMAYGHGINDKQIFTSIRV